MLKDTAQFLHKIHNTILEFAGPIQEAYQLRHSPRLIQELKAMKPQLIYQSRANSYLQHRKI